MRAIAVALLLALSAPAQEPLPQKKTDSWQGNVKFLIPNVRTWTKASSKDGWTWYYVWLAEPDYCHLKIWDGQKLDGEFRAAFDAEVAKYVAANGKLKATNGVKESTTSEGVAALQQTIEIEAKHGTVYAWFVGFQPKDRFELLAYTAGTEATWLKHAEDAKTFMTNILFVNMPDPAKTGGAAGYKAGDRVDILFGGQWYPGEVLEAGDGKWKVHYDGYGANWDSWVEAEKLRPGKPAAAADPFAGGRAAAVPAPGGPAGDPQVGEICEATWNKSWYEVEVLEVAGGKYRVKWRGYGDKADWVTREELRRKGEEREVLPAPDRLGDGGGLPPDQMVGKSVEVFWRGSWWPAKVLKADGAKLYVEYMNPQHGSTVAEWAVRERVRAAGLQAARTVDPAKVPGKKGLDGLWWSAFYDGRYNTRAGQVQGGVQRRHVLFFPDGRVVRNFPPDEGAEVDWAAYCARMPDLCGGYGIEGDKIRFEWGGDADPVPPATFKVVDENRLEINGVPWFRPRPFAKGQRLNGTWSGESGPHHYTWTFRDDGTYESVMVLTIVMEDGTHGVKETRTKGRYTIAGHGIHTVDDTGKTSSHLAWPDWAPGEPEKVLVMLGGDLIKK